MEYKIYHTAIQFSKPPYVLENMKVDINLFHQMWKSDETKWEYIGSVPTLEIARCLVEQDKQFVIINNKKYELNCEPSDECYYEFVKIESDDFVEYYDSYHEDNNVVFKRNKSFTNQI